LRYWILQNFTWSVFFPGKRKGGGRKDRCKKKKKSPAKEKCEKRNRNEKKKKTKA